MTNEDKYYVISNSEGDVYVYEYSKEKLEEELNEEDSWLRSFINGVKTNEDTNYWGSSKLIIKGKIVVPENKSVVIKRVIE